MSFAESSFLADESYIRMKNDMTLPEIARARLQLQALTDTPADAPEAVVAHLGAVQAQDYAMAKWAVGCRTDGLTHAEVQRAIDQGRILRTHVMRPTWHFVAAADIRWMLALTADRIRATMKGYALQSGLTPEVLSKSRKVFEKALSDGPLTREAILGAHQAQGIETHQRSSLLLAYAELDALICSGPDQDGKPTYALLDQRVPTSSASYSADEAAALLARRYFDSHSPATDADFSWWSGLSLTQARRAIAANALNSFETEGQRYFLPKDRPMRKTAPSTLLLAAFDEFLISYRDRSASLQHVHSKRTISPNGIFSPVVVSDGQVRGTWKRTVKKSSVHFDLQPFETLSEHEHRLIEKEKERFALFLGKQAVLS